MKLDLLKHRPDGTLVYYALFIIPVLFFTGVVLLLFYKSNQLANSPVNVDPTTLPLYGRITQWFDPVFFQYNLVLLIFAVAIVPLITYCYVHSMGREKRRRLRRELPPEAFTNKETADYINNQLDNAFAMRNYFGSMMTLTFIVMLGSMIILLLKPMPLDATGVAGVDYSKGANFLMLGPYMQSYMQGNTSEYITVLISSLTAFQFGFLGAYVYFIGHLVRSYFTLDMTPNIFVSSSIRMITGSLLALVLCYVFVEPELAPKLALVDDDNVLHEMFVKGLPVWSFFIGFFPSRGLVLIENISTKVLGLLRIREYATPLSDLPGMSYAHEIRLSREGYDNIENLANANALDLALRTGFSYLQLSRWISQARLYGYLRNDYHLFADRTGITTLDDFIDYWQAAKTNASNGDPASELIAATQTDKHNFNEKIHILGRLAESIKAKNTPSTASAAIAAGAGKNMQDNEATT
jgi:hypothetical protein